MADRDLTRTDVLWLVAILAAALYAFGLIGPLTPSEGKPGLGELVGYVGVPLGLIAGAMFLTRTWLGRVLLFCEAWVIVAVTEVLGIARKVLAA